MHRVDGTGATASNRFTEGDPTQGVPATVVDAEWLNAVQEELVAVIEALGLTLDKNKNSQLWEAVEKLYGKTHSGDPNGNVAADSVYERCWDTSQSAPTLYIATTADGTTGGTTWEQIGGSGGGGGAPYPLDDGEYLDSYSLDAEISSKEFNGINIRQIAYDGLYAYAAVQGSYDGTQQGKVEIFDLSEPDNIQKMTSIDVGAVGDGPRAIAVRGNTMYVGTFDGQDLLVYDVSDVVDPTLENTINIGSNLHTFLIDGDTMYIGTWGNGVLVWNLGDGYSPSQTASISLASAEVASLELARERLFVPNSDSPGTMYIVDVSDPSSPVEVNSVTVADNTRHVAYANGFVYAAGPAQVNYVSVVDVRDPNAAQEVNQIDVGAPVSSLLTVGDYLFTAMNNSDENRAYDVSDPINPVLERTYSKMFKRMFMSGQWIFGVNIGEGAQGGSDPSDGNNGTDLVSYLWDAWARRAGRFRSLRADVFEADRVKGRVAEFDQITVPGGGFSFDTGEFTPEIFFGGANSGLTYNNRWAAYTKIGNLVHFTILLNINDVGSSTGDVTIGSLPYPMNPASPLGGNFSFTVGQILNVTIDNHVYGTVDTGGVDMTLKTLDGTGSARTLTNSDVNNFAVIGIQGTYTTT